MCVIIAKRAGQPIPPNYMLEFAHRYNPHGCGFASTRHAYKGLDFKRFMQELAKVGDDEMCIIHFRYATHGSVCNANCHPFKSGDVYFAHNGVLPIESKHDMTDSEIAFKDTIMPAVVKYGYASNGVHDVISGIIGGSRFAMLKGGHMILYGHFVDVNGYMCSNDHFMPFALRTAKRA